MKLISLFLFFIVFTFNIFSQSLFGVWNSDIYYVGTEEYSSIEVEFLDDQVIFHYEDGESSKFEYYFDDFDNMNLLFIGQVGYYYEFINDNIFRLVPAFGSDQAEIIFYRGHNED